MSRSPRRTTRLHVQLDVVDRGCGSRVAFDLGEFAINDGEPVVARGVEVDELIDTVEHIAHELLEEHARCDAYLAAELAGDGAGQELDIRVVATRSNPFRVASTGRVEIADATTDFAEPV